MNRKMRPPSFRGPIVIAAILAVLLLAAAGGWWLCERSAAIAFLPARPGAEWIIYPAPPVLDARQAFPVRAIFKRTFVLETPPANATCSAPRPTSRQCDTMP